MKNKIRLFSLIFITFLLVGCGTDSSEAVSTVSSEVTSDSIDNVLSDSIQEIINNKEYYPDITSIEVTPDYTLFTITLESDVMNTYESMLVMSFYTAGNEQQIASGISPENVKTIVRYVNGSTNEIISESDSSAMKTE